MPSVAQILFACVQVCPIHLFSKMNKVVSVMENHEPTPKLSKPSTCNDLGHRLSLTGNANRGISTPRSPVTRNRAFNQRPGSDLSKPPADHIRTRQYFTSTLPQPETSNPTNSNVGNMTSPAPSIPSKHYPSLNLATRPQGRRRGLFYQIHRAQRQMMRRTW